MVLHVKTGLKHLAEDGYLEQFKKVIETAFGARGFDLAPEFFDNLNSKDIAYIVLHTDDSDKFVEGCLLGLHEQSDITMQSYGLDTDYVVIDKIAVHPDHQNNGNLSSIMHLAKDIRFGENQKQIPTLWRTSSPQISKKYEKFSDFRDQHFTANGYYVHGFGFDSKQCQHHYQDSRKLFEYMAGVVAAKPSTLVKIETGLTILSPSLTERLTV